MKIQKEYRPLSEFLIKHDKQAVLEPSTFFTSSNVPMALRKMKRFIAQKKFVLLN